MLDLAKGFQKLDTRHKAEPIQPAAKSVFSEQAGSHSKDRANMGKVTRFVPHGDDCSCIPCRRALIREQRSMEPLTFRDKVHITLVTLSGLGILGLFAMAWMASR